jgi:MFS family permease
MTGSSAWVGVASLVALGPLIVFALWGGAIADTLDRRKLLLFTNVSMAMLLVAFWLQAALQIGSIPLLLALVAVQQALFGLNMPARTASVARLVPIGELPAAVALNSTVMQAGWIAGPLAAGALIPVIGLSTLYLVDAIALTATIWAVWRLPALPPLNGEARRAGWRDVINGFGYLATHRLLLVSFLADIIAMVFGMPRALFPERPTSATRESARTALGLIRGDPDQVARGRFARAPSHVRRHG